MTPKIPSILFFLLCVNSGSVSCKPNPASTQSPVKAKPVTPAKTIKKPLKRATKKVVPARIEKPIVISWAFNKYETKDGFPEAKVYLQFENFQYEGSNRLFLGKEEGWPMNAMPEEHEFQFMLFNAGAGVLFWVKKEDSNLVIYRQYVSEDTDTQPPELKLKTIPFPNNRQLRFHVPKRR
jgi:hypothetical protein